MVRSPLTGREITTQSTWRYISQIISQYTTESPPESVRVARSPMPTHQAIRWVEETLEAMGIPNEDRGLPWQQPETCPVCNRGPVSQEGMCEDCLYYCTYCEDTIDEDHTTTLVGGHSLCGSCIAEYTQPCHSCQQNHLSDNLRALHRRSRGIEIICIECARQENNIQFNYLSGRLEERPEDNYVETSGPAHNWVSTQEGLSIFRISTGERGIEEILERIYRYNRTRNERDQLKIIERRLEEVPNYNRMPTDGTCIYLCGRDASNRSSEHLACEQCAPNTLCRECEPIGRPECIRCLTKKKTKIEKDQTTTRPQRIWANNYHPSQHLNFKAKKLRLKTERPYLYYGVEIEVELPSNVDRVAFAETVCLEAEGIFVAERDGSLMNGVEFISRPISYKVWESEDMQRILDKVFAKMNEFGVFTVNQSTAGMHVHMSKVFFQKSKTKTVEQQKEDMAWLFEYYDEEIAKLSRRELNMYCTSRKMVIQQQMKDIRIASANYSINIGKEGPVISQGSGPSHHHMVSETGHTIEVRTFSAPKNPNHILAAIEMCRNLAHYARNYKLKGVNLGQILQSKKSPHLDKYIKELGLNLHETKQIQDTIMVEVKKKKDIEEIF